MPNKSNAQAHLMAAVTNKPEQTDGDFEEVSELPIQVSEEIELDEASGVGILKVPPTLMKKVQNYVGSVILTMAVMKQHELSNQGKTQEAEAFLNWCKRFQRKYSTSVLSPADLKKYVNSTTVLKLDANEIYNELPENLKKNPKTKELIDKMTIVMKISNQFLNKAGSSGTSGTDNDLDIGVPKYADIKNLSIDGTIELLNYSMGTIQHELQHTIQSVVLRNLNSNDAQTKRADNYSGNHTQDDLYYAGGVEFGPQIKDLALRATEYLEDNVDKLSGKKNHDISNAINYAMSTMSQSKVISVLRKYKQDARANKAMKLLYREVSNFYENDLHTENDHEFDSSEKDISTGEKFERSQEYPEAGDSLMGDLYLKVWREFGEQPEISSSSDAHDPSQFTLRVHGGYDDSYNIVFRHGHNDDYFILIKPDGGEKFRIDFTEEQMKKLPVEYLGNMRGIKKIQEMTEQENAPDSNLSGMLFSIENINENAGFFNNKSDRSVSFTDYIEDEGFFEIEMADVRSKIIVQSSSKKYSVDIASGENTFIGSEKEIEELFNKIFEAYYSDNVEPRHVNKALLYSDSVSDFDESLEYYVQRTAKRRERGEAMAESTMRGWVDVIQDAELSHDIDDADEQELINKDQLQEMPARFDAFAGEDPIGFIDSTAKKTSQSNMIPVAEHEGFSVFKSKNGSGYIAYDESNKEIAIVSGQLVGKVFHIEAIAAKRGHKGIVYQMYMDMLNNGLQILSDSLHSDDAIRFWKKLITNHEVYVVADGEIIQRATPQKFDKYWGDEDSPSADLQFLLVK